MPDQVYLAGHFSFMALPVLLARKRLVIRA